MSSWVVVLMQFSVESFAEGFVVGSCFGIGWSYNYYYYCCCNYYDSLRIGLNRSGSWNSYRGGGWEGHDICLVLLSYGKV